MYKFESEAFGMCIARARKHLVPAVENVKTIEIETFHGFRSTVSTYRYEPKAAPRERPAQFTDAALCRKAVAHFLDRNVAVHIAREEMLDMALPAFKGTLASMYDKVNSRASRPHNISLFKA
jgi:hypothetical protein